MRCNNTCIVKPDIWCTLFLVRNALFNVDCAMFLIKVTSHTVHPHNITDSSLQFTKGIHIIFVSREQEGFPMVKLNVLANLLVSLSICRR